MTEKIIEILKENETLTECKQYFLVKRKDYQKVANEIEVAINYKHCCTELRDKKAPTFNEFMIEFDLKADRDNEYFFDGDFFDSMGLYFKYTEHYGINP